MPDNAVSSRRAALLAHALPAADREWLLGELAAPQRLALGVLLEQLRSMRVPRDPALLRQLVDTDPGTDPQRALAGITAQELQILLKVLRDEPAVLVGRLLTVHAWPWREAVLQDLGQSVETLSACGVERVDAPRLDRAIVASVWRAVQRAKAAADLRPPTSWRNRFRTGART